MDSSSLRRRLYLVKFGVIAFVLAGVFWSSQAVAMASCDEAKIYLNASSAALRAAEGIPLTPKASFEKRITLLNNADQAETHARSEGIGCDSLDVIDYTIVVDSWFLAMAADSSHALEPYVTNPQCKTYSRLVAKSSIAAAYEASINIDNPPWVPETSTESSVHAHVPSYVRRVAGQYGVVLPDSSEHLQDFLTTYKQATENYKATMTAPCRTSVGMPKAILLVFFGE